MSTENRRNRSESGQKRRKPITDDGSSLIDRSPPYDLMAEKAVLGCVLLNSDTLNELTLILRGDDFYEDAQVLNTKRASAEEVACIEEHESKVQC